MKQEETVKEIRCWRGVRTGTNGTTSKQLTQNDHVVNYPIAVSECQRSNTDYLRTRTHRMSSDINGVVSALW